MVVAAILLIGIITDEVYANKHKNPPNPPPLDAKVRAIQNGNSLDEENPGIIGEDIYCVGGIDASSRANDIHCYLIIDPNVPTEEYNNPQHIAAGHVVKIDGDSTNISNCPQNAGFQADDICFWISFPAEHFPTPGRYRFVAEFTKDGQIIDIAGTDWKNHSFMVVPEAILGALAILGSMFAAFAIYNRRKN